MIFQNEKTPFQAIKTKSSKSRKIDIFPKGLTHGFGPKMAIFPTFFFQAIQARKMSFMIFQNDKTPFQAIKTRSPKSRKIDIFPKALTHGFGPKMAIFRIFFLGNLGQENVFTIFQNEKMPFYAIKTTSSKSRKTDIFSKGVNLWIRSKKKAIFPTFFFQGNQARKMIFTIFQKEKTPFQAIKTRSSKSQIIDIFPKELTHCFGPKMAIFPTFFLGKFGKEKVYYDIPEQKNASQIYKNTKLKTSKN